MERAGCGVVRASVHYYNSEDEVERFASGFRRARRGHPAEDHAMKIGISITSAYDVADPREGARRMIDRTAAAPAGRLDSLFVGDHHSTPQAYYQNTAIMGRLLAEWGDRPFGAPLPAAAVAPGAARRASGTLAASAAAASSSSARSATAPTQFPAMGVDSEAAPSRFEQSLDIIVRLLAGEEVRAPGAGASSARASRPRPAEPVEYWIGASAEPAIDRAARLGDGWLARPGLTPDQARAQLDRTASGARRTVPPLRSPSAATSTWAPPRKRRERPPSPSCAPATAASRPRRWCTGSVDEVAESFPALAAMGYSDVIVRHLTDDQPKVLGSLARLAEVRAALKDT